MTADASSATHHTERLTLRPVRREDRKFLLQLFGNPDVTRYYDSF